MWNLDFDNSDDDFDPDLDYDNYDEVEAQSSESSKLKDTKWKLLYLIRIQNVKDQ
jgi:hypothetical protein